MNAAAMAASIACSVCFSATEENRMAFLMTTLFLTLLPLALIGGGALWIRKQLRDHGGPRV